MQNIIDICQANKVLDRCHGDQLSGSFDLFLTILFFLKDLVYDHSF